MYIELDEGYTGHRKTLRFCALMQTALAEIYPIRLWQWACRSCPDGDLTDMEPTEIEFAIRYSETNGRCYAALVKAGFIDEHEDGSKTIHNWGKRTGAAIDRMSKEAVRKKMVRLHNDERCPGAPACHICNKGDARPRTIRGQSADNPQDVPPQSRPVKASQVQSSKASEREACAETPPASSTPAAPVPIELFPSEAPVLEFPCDGPARTWALTRSFVEECRKAYPSLDIEAEARKAKLWIEANPERRKTAKGMPTFIANWLSRTQNRSTGGGARASPHPSLSPKNAATVAAVQRWSGSSEESNAGTRKI